MHLHRPTSPFLEAKSAPHGRKFRGLEGGPIPHFNGPGARPFVQKQWQRPPKVYKQRLVLCRQACCPATSKFMQTTLDKVLMDATKTWNCQTPCLQKCRTNALCLLDEAFRANGGYVALDTKPSLHLTLKIQYSLAKEMTIPWGCSACSLMVSITSNTPHQGCPVFLSTSLSPPVPPLSAIPTRKCKMQMHKWLPRRCMVTTLSVETTSAETDVQQHLAPFHVCAPHPTLETQGRPELAALTVVQRLRN